jgi:hypothetical protein
MQHIIHLNPGATTGCFVHTLFQPLSLNVWLEIVPLASSSIDV